jgi:tetratricopeptide (TPR) repeat protein
MTRPLVSILLLAFGLAGCASTPGKVRGDRPPEVPVEVGEPTAEAAAGQEELARAIELFDGGELEAAEVRLLAFRQTHPENAAAALYLGRIYFEQQRYAESVGELEAAVALDDTEVEHYLWLGRALGERIHKVVFLLQVPMAKRILAAFTRAVELDPDSVRGHLALARFYSEAPPFAGGDREKALHHAAELIRLDPLEGYLRRAAIYERFGEADLAERDLLSALGALLAGRPDHPQAEVALERLVQELAGGAGAAGGSPPE